MAEEIGKSSASGAPDESMSNANKRKWLLLGLTGVFLLAAIAYGCYWFLVAQFYVQTSDAYVHGNRVKLTPQIAGTVIAIYADDTDYVKSGQPMIELDRSDKRVALQHAKAVLGGRVREVHQIFEEASEQAALVAMRKAELAQARRDHERDQALIKIKGVSRKQFQQSRLQFDGAKAKLAQAEHKLLGLRALTDNADVYHNPKVEQASAATEAAYLDLQRTEIVAPISGYVAQRQVQLGEKVDPSKPMLAIVGLDNVWVEANFKETQLTQMRIGQPVTVTADVYGDDIVYHGKVAGISAGSGSVFELLPPQNATGNWIKIVQRVPVRVSLDADEVGKHPLRLGLSLQVSVDIHNTDGDALATQAGSQPVLSTEVYRQRKNDAQALIEQVIDANVGAPVERLPASTTHGG